MFNEIFNISWVYVLGFKITITLAIVVCFIFPSLWRYCLRKYKLYKAAGRFPGPKALPIIGNTLDLKSNGEDLLDKGMEWAKQYSSPFRCWVGPNLYLIIHRAEHDTVLHSEVSLGKSPVGNFGKDFFGNGLLVAPVPIWRAHRKHVSSAFSSRILASYSVIFAEKSQQMIKQLESELHGKGFEISRYISPCALGMIIQAGLGVSLKIDSEALVRYSDALTSVFDSLMIRTSRIWLYPDIIFNRTTLGKKTREAMKYLCSITEKAIQQRKQLQTEQASSEYENFDTETCKSSSECFLDILTSLYQNGIYYTEKDYKDEINNFIAAGSHTISSHMDFMTYLLANNPDIQEKVYKELYSIYGSVDSSEKPVQLEDLPRMKYLECVIRETMRLFPAVPVILRDVKEDLDTGKCVLPEGSTAAIFIFGIHRNEKYWPNPLKFDPDRFLPENAGNLHPGAYLPFSLGPRNCIGLKYAMIAMKIMSATLLKRYVLRTDTITSVENVKLKCHTVLQFAEPWKVRIEERNTKNSVEK